MKVSTPVPDAVPGAPAHEESRRAGVVFQEAWAVQAASPRVRAVLVLAGEKQAAVARAVPTHAVAQLAPAALARGWMQRVEAWRVVPHCGQRQVVLVSSAPVRAQRD